MREQISILTQSRFFSPVFNGAIFDGPIRIYFSQSQESAAMKLYFAILTRMKNNFGDLRDCFSDQSPNIFIMMYPTSDSFRVVFPSDQVTLLQVDELDADHIIGLNGPIDENDFPQLYTVLDRLVATLPRNIAQQPVI